MKQYHYIEAQTDKFGHRQVLWNTGNYMYEIEDRTAKKTLKLECSFEEAKRILQEVCVSH
jgi:hypothetical protein